MGEAAEQQPALRRPARAGVDDGGRHGWSLPSATAARRPARRLELMLTHVHLADTCRLVPSLFPSTGILDRIAVPEDLPLIFELESWTNDRISTELGILHRIPKEEWITGRPMASVIM